MDDLGIEAIGKLWAQLGVVGFLLIIVWQVVSRLGEIASLLAKKRLNGRLTPQPDTARTPSCAWSHQREKEWERVVEQVDTMSEQDKMIKTGIDQGTFTCQWTPANIGDLQKAMSDLCTEVKLLRLEVELTRKNQG